MCLSENTTASFSDHVIFQIQMTLKKYIVLIVGVTLLSLGNVQAQLLSQDEIYSREFIYGVNFNTNGGLIGGLMFKFSSLRNTVKMRQYSTFGIEIVNIKHNKESRVNSFTGNSYIFNKVNYLYTIRPTYGRDFILFRKAPEEGVQVSAVFAIGASIGIVKPYHVLYQDALDQSISSVAFDPDVHQPSQIIGAGNFLEGFQDARIVPGLNAKFGFSFDFGAFKNSVTGFEAGFHYEAYAQKIELMRNPTTFPEIGNRQFFSSVYLTVFFGTRK